jgi:hypothetical protein
LTSVAPKKVATRTTRIVQLAVADGECTINL